MANPHLRYNGPFEQPNTVTTSKKLEELGKSPRRIYAHLRTEWTKKFNQKPDLFCLTIKNEVIATELDISVPNAERALKKLESAGLLIRIPYYFADKRRIQGTAKGERRRWLVPIDLDQKTRVDVLKACREKTVEIGRTRYSTICNALVRHIDALLPEPAANTSSNAESSSLFDDADAW